MKIYLIILAVFLLMVSCQANKKEGYSLMFIVEKGKTSTKKGINDSNSLRSKTTLTKEQFNDFFPKQIGAYKLINVSVLMSSALASALYVQDNDFIHSMTYNLEDGDRKNVAAIKNFEVSYNLKDQGPTGTEYIYTERGGYKTISFIQPDIKRNDIRFVYNNRFRITLEGTDSADALWLYIDFENLKKLD